MKNEVAANAVALASLAREGFRPPGDIVLIAAADEEVGKSFGLEWLCEEHPDAVRVDYALNEGGGERVVLGGDPYYLCASAEKMTAPFRLRVRGRSGHASMPGIADNALVKAAGLIEALAAYRPEAEIGPEVAGFLDDGARRGAARGRGARAAARLRPARGRSDRAAPLLHALADDDRRLRVAQRHPRHLRRHRRLPHPRRPLAGGRRADRAQRARRCSRWGDYELEWIERWGGTRSSLETPLWSAIEEWVAELEPGARVAPLCCTGLHRLALAPRGVRHGRVRLLPDADDGSRARHASDPLGRRAGARRRSRARRRVPAPRRALARVAVLELSSPEGAFERIEA